MKVEYSGIKQAIARLEKLKKKVGSDKLHEILQQLAEIGVSYARAGFNSAIYDGHKDVSVEIEWESENAVCVTARGQTVLFIEFGSGARYGYGHPLADQYGYGPGTWSTNEALGGKGHWDDENGWYYEHGKKSWGNPPSMTMYNTSKEIQAKINEVIKGVLG